MSCHFTAHSRLPVSFMLEVIITYSGHLEGGEVKCVWSLLFPGPSEVDVNLPCPPSQGCLGRATYKACRNNMTHGSVVLISKAWCFLFIYLFKLFGYILEVSQDGFQILHDCLDLLFDLYFGDYSFSICIWCPWHSSVYATIYFVKDLKSNPFGSTLPLCQRIILVLRSPFHFCSYITARTERSGVGQRSISTTRHAQ